MKALVCVYFAVLLNAQSVSSIGSADTSVVPLARSQYDGDWWIFTNVPAHRLYLDGFLDGRGNTDSQVTDQVSDVIGSQEAAAAPLQHEVVVQQSAGRPLPSRTRLAVSAYFSWTMSLMLLNFRSYLQHMIFCGSIALFRVQHSA